MFNQYPYLNIQDLNLDYILKAIREMRYEVTNFVSINAIKYANPIQWNITTQYEKNTIVIDPVTGTAYISVAPVPAGVALTRPEYWTVVFDLGSFVTKAAQNFTSRWESETTLTATFPTNTGEWLVWGDVLYKAKSNIIAGDQYVVGSNIEHFTIEDLYNAYLNTIANILAMIGDLADLATSDTSDLVHAINSVLSDINTTIGDLANLATSDKSSIVNAINETENDINNLLDNRFYVTPQMYGAVGDGVTDDSQAFNDAIQAGVVIVPLGTYYIANNIALDGNKTLISPVDNTGARCRLVMEVGASVEISGNNNTLSGFELYSPTNHQGTGISFGSGSSRSNVIKNLSIMRMEYAINSDATLWCTLFENILITSCVNGIVNTGLTLVCNFTEIYFSYVHKLLNVTKFDCVTFQTCNFGIVKGNSFTLNGEAHVTFNECNFECDAILDTAGAIFTIDEWYTRFINCTFKLQGTSSNYGFDTTGNCKGLSFEFCSLKITGGSMPRVQFWGNIVVGANGAIYIKETFNFPPLTSNANALSGFHDIYQTEQTNIGTSSQDLTTVVIPAKSYYCIQASLGYNSERPKLIKITTSDNSNTATNGGNETGTGNNTGISAAISGFTKNGFTATIKGCYYNSSSERYFVSGFYYIADNIFISP